MNYHVHFLFWRQWKTLQISSFRHVVSEAARPDVFFTEFTNTESFCHPEGIHSVRGRLTFSEDEQPMVAHIWGDKPEQFRETSIQLAKMGFKGIDLNMDVL